MTVIESDINDSVFTKLVSADKTNYLAIGNLRFASLCSEYAIDSASIPASRPWVPLRIGVLCVLIAVTNDKLGSDWKEIASGGVYDPNKAKLDAYNTELEELLKKFTPSQCGYIDDDDADDGISPICKPFLRA